MYIDTPEYDALHAEKYLELLTKYLGTTTKGGYKIALDETERTIGLYLAGAITQATAFKRTGLSYMAIDRMTEALKEQLMSKAARLIAEEAREYWRATYSPYQLPLPFPKSQYLKQRQYELGDKR